MAKAASLTLIIGSFIDETISNSIVIGRYFNGMSLCQFKMPLNNLKETVRVSPGFMVIYSSSKFPIGP